MVAACGCGDESPAHAVNADQPTDVLARLQAARIQELSHDERDGANAEQGARAQAPLQLVLLSRNFDRQRATERVFVVLDTAAQSGSAEGRRISALWGSRGAGRSFLARRV
jgi:hypothetical protein